MKKQIKYIVTYLGPLDILSHHTNPTGSNYSFVKNSGMPIAEIDAKHYAKKSSFSVVRISGVKKPKAETIGPKSDDGGT